ncbi:uncharacterized protein LOC119068403 [Bradysia coprophila]|uniref:uncharacterized protein LOC119068403 n=1 Tax=Bradysia coprophila TaxID=38358 RepID=UPI00187D882B|nr:uncharacterized protein LOC119068403 [Bradysia coprophila]XP_037027860.1 uncharacterized protein LOC119068403 [Bradysia coprophila]
MGNCVYILTLLVAVVALALLWLPSLWFMNSSVRTETAYQDYVKRNVLKQLHDRCSDGELTWVLRHLKSTEDVQKLNRSEIRAKIVDIQSHRISQWEFGSDEERIITPIINEICTQNYDVLISELEENCTIQELHNICNYISVDKCDESNSNSKSDWIEEIMNVQRIKIYTNVTKSIDKFCIERHIELLAKELIVSCTGGRIKKIFDKLSGKQGDVMCGDCVEKMEFVEAVIEVKRRDYYQVNVEPLLDEFCVRPELDTLKQKLMENCSGIQIKQIFEEIDDKSTCDYCVEKTDFVTEIINAKRRQFSAINVNTLIQEYCFKSVED